MNTTLLLPITTYDDPCNYSSNGDDGDDNNQAIPPSLHVLTTLLVITVFFVSLEQACSLSIKHHLFRIRIGVLLSNAILTVLSIAINFDLLRISKHIHFLDKKFGLIVRTLQIFWLAIAFFIGYFFVIYSINSAYKSSSNVVGNNDDSNSKSNTLSKKAPKWMSKFWLICTTFVELSLFLGFIIAIALEDIFFIQFVWCCAYMFAVIGASLVFIALIDIKKYVDKKTKYNKSIKNKPIKGNNDSSTNSTNQNIKKFKRILITMVIMCIVIICAAMANVVIIMDHWTKLAKCGAVLRPDQQTLYSSAIDNPGDFLTYFLVLICVEISFVFWTYKPSAVNYFLFFCCNGYKKYAVSNTPEQIKPFKLDRDTMCYAFCKSCIDKAEHKRRTLIELQVQQNQNQTEPQNIRQITNTTEQFNNTHNTPQRPSYFSITNVGATPQQQQQQQHIVINNHDNTHNIKIILYDFDGVLTNKRYRYFEHWTLNETQVLTQKHLNATFGDDQRINHLYQHFDFLISNNIQIYCISSELTSKINTIFRKLQFDRYFDGDTIIGSDHKLIENENPQSQTKTFILNLTNQQNVVPEELLYISANDENVTHFAKINLCATYGIKSENGMDENDIMRIQNTLI